MKELLSNKFKECFKSILPITLIVVIVSLFFPTSDLITLIPPFLFGSLLLIVGMCFFEIGADVSMVSIGDKIGNHLTNKKNKFFILFICFIIGFIVTVAEPDLTVLATQVPGIKSGILITTVGVGVGLFLLLAALRMLHQWKYSYLIIFLVIVSFVLAYFVPEEFVPLAFDSGGVTTGPLSVPLMIALGAGLSSMRSDSKKNDDTFGMISFCSVGPVIIVLLLGLLYHPSASYDLINIIEYSSILDMLYIFACELPSYLLEVLMSLGPIVILFLLYDFFFLKLRKNELIKIFKGLFYTYVGLSIFLTGVNVGFMPMGYLVGKELSEFTYVLPFFGVIVGYFIVSSEPAISVLTEQIEELTNGKVKKKIMDVSLAIGVSIATGLAIVRVITGLSIWYFLVPGYLFAIIMTFFVPPMFTAIAFDSGGVASGTMTGTFLLPLVIGISEALGKNVLTDAFGLIAIVATIPLITVQFIGLVYNIKSKVSYNDPVYNEEIIDY